MTGWPREFCDENTGVTLVIGPSGPGGRCYLRAERKDHPVDAWAPSVIIGSPEIPALTAAMLEACGLRPFLVMAAPAARYPLVPGPHGEESVTVTPSPGSRPSNVPGVMLATGGAGIRLTGDEPMLVAVALVTAMQKAETDPDPSDVDALAAVIRHALCPGSGRPGESDRASARAALRWMRDREARDG